MNKTKIVMGFIILTALLALQVGAAYAAPASQTADITGTIQSITQSTDSGGNTIFIVTIDVGGTTQTVKLSAADAVSLGLVTQNPDGTYTINNVVGTTVTIPSGMIPVDPCSETEKGMVASALAAFFCQGGSTVVDNSISALHAEGFGFGEIAQACFMAEVLNSTCGDVLTAKQNHDYSTLGLPSDVNNWGRLRKYALGQEVKSLTNLGAIMSGRASAPAVSSTPIPTPMWPFGSNGKGNGHGHGNGGQGGNGNGNGNGHKP